MYRRIVAAAALALMCAAPAFAQTNTGTDKKIDQASANFLTETAQDGRAEVQMSQLAMQRASNPDVKAFAQRMISDHSKMNQEVQELAARKGIVLPATPSSDGQDAYQRLAALSGSDFDREYMQHNVTDHQKDVSAFQQEAQSGKDSDVQRLAATRLPGLQRHLQLAQTIQQRVG